MKKNLLYIFADQWRAQAAEHMCMDQVETPNITSFLQEGLEFTNATSTYPLCSPHRAALMTGKYPYSCGFWTNCKNELDEIVMLKPQETTISDVLFESGYQNGYIGKWHLDAAETNFSPVPKSGATGWNAFTPAGERRHHFDYWHVSTDNNHTSPTYILDGPNKVTFEGKWSVELETELAINYMDNRDKDKPFNLFVSWNPPHGPYDKVPQEYKDLYKDVELKFRDNVPRDVREDEAFVTRYRDYLAAVHGLDIYFGKIIKYLKDNNLYDDTLIVLSSDHGDTMGSHRLFDKNNWYEESVRIPLYIGGAGVKGGKSDALIGSQDHMPTILDYLGCEIPETVQGISFANILRGEKMENEPTEAFLCMYPGMPALVSAYRKRGYSHKCFGWRAIRTKELTYVINNGTTPDEPQKRYVYDNVADPYQMNPTELASIQSVAFDKKLQKYLDLTNDPFLMNR